ncbi:hypothetical protein Nepgr_024005 [Nepenthes gracilis]|uniref:Uncharacterized protein n=1 Tax=Nepenthes gracilis TaxID=150966 RepID=A0AAD3T3W5_NEPGR|nr:hypothetical protein Nepgr_024005 [Nepenthes gracilis]
MECNQVDIDIEQQSVTSCEHLSCLGQPDPSSAKGGVLGGNEAPVFQVEQAAELKPPNKALRVTADQQTSLGYQEFQTPVMAGVHTSDHFNEAGSPGKVVDDLENAQLLEGETEESLVNERDGHICVQLEGEQHLMSQLPPESANASTCSSPELTRSPSIWDANSLADQEDIIEDQHHVPYADILKRGIISIDDEKPGPRAAHMSIRPITDVDRLDALGISNCHEEEVGSLDHHHQDGDPRPCTNLE